MASKYHVGGNIHQKLVEPNITVSGYGGAMTFSHEGDTIEYFAIGHPDETVALMGAWALQSGPPSDPAIRTQRHKQDVSLEQVTQRLDHLERLVQHVSSQLDQLLDESATATEISEIGDLQVSRPIPIVLEETAGEVVARWPEAGLTGVGRSEGEAIESLREEVAVTWEDLATATDGELSKHARMIRNVMRHYADAAS